MVWMRLRKESLFALLEPGAVRLVVDDLTPLVLYHLSLIVQLLLRQPVSQRSHPTRARAPAPADLRAPVRSSSCGPSSSCRSCQDRSARPPPRGEPDAARQ